MPNPHLLQRLAGIQSVLNGVHEAGAGMSGASRGTERQAFIDHFLSQVLPTPFRFGTGDATDETGQRSGQLDVVVETPLMPSLPLPSGTARLYLAESIAAVIEVKSNVADQWTEVLSTMAKLSPLRRKFKSVMSVGARPSEHIPLFAVGYTGWKTLDTVRSKIVESGIDGILVIDPGLFVAAGGMTGSGCLALWGLICSLTILTSTPHLAIPDPQIYARP